MPSIRSEASALTDITTPSERSNITSTSTVASTVTRENNMKTLEKFKKVVENRKANEEFEKELAKEDEKEDVKDDEKDDEKMELESEAGQSVMTSLSDLGSTVTSKRDSEKME
jgi:hypothetical protein